MVRPREEGLDYWPQPVDLFDWDELHFVVAKHGLAARGVLSSLLNALFSVGYCFRWGPKDRVIFADKIRAPLALVEEIISDAVNEGFFSENLLNSHQILTAKWIQESHENATKKRTRVEYRREWLLFQPKNPNVYIKEPETPVKVPQEFPKLGLEVTETPQRILKDSKGKEIISINARANPDTFQEPETPVKVPQEFPKLGLEVTETPQRIVKEIKGKEIISINSRANPDTFQEPGNKNHSEQKSHLGAASIIAAASPNAAVAGFSTQAPTNGTHELAQANVGERCAPQNESEDDRWLKVALTYLEEPNDQDWTRTNAHVNSGKRPLKKFPKLFFTGTELSRVLRDFRESQIPDRLIRKGFELLESQVITQRDRGMPDTSHAVSLQGWVKGSLLKEFDQEERLKRTRSMNETAGIRS